MKKLINIMLAAGMLYAGINTNSTARAEESCSDPSAKKSLFGRTIEFLKDTGLDIALKYEIKRNTPHIPIDEEIDRYFLKKGIKQKVGIISAYAGKDAVQGFLEVYYTRDLPKPTAKYEAEYKNKNVGKVSVGQLMNDKMLVKEFRRKREDWDKLDKLEEHAHRFFRDMVESGKISGYELSSMPGLSFTTLLDKDLGWNCRLSECKTQGEFGAKTWKLDEQGNVKDNLRDYLIYRADYSTLLNEWGSPQLKKKETWKYFKGFGKKTEKTD